MIVWSAKFPWKAPSSNHSYLRSSNGRMFMPKEVKEFKDNVARMARYTYSGVMRTEKLACEITLCFKDKRRRDISNHIKATMDALQGVVYEDDKQFEDIRILKGEEKEDSVTIKIWTI